MGEQYPNTPVSEDPTANPKKRPPVFAVLDRLLGLALGLSGVLVILNIPSPVGWPNLWATLFWGILAAIVVWVILTQATSRRRALKARYRKR